MKPVPAMVITGPLGSGKTTVISRLLAGKPAAENWVVLLNEFSDAGIDALTVASQARGAFDVRLVPGGCLCCLGEQDFRRNLNELLDTVHPDRIVVEPSGIGHPAGIVEELLAHQSRGRLSLEVVVALLDPASLDACADGRGELARAAAEIADSLVLSKADTASADQRLRFAELAAELFPAKSWVGESVAGRLPPAALESGGRPRSSAPARPAIHEAARHAAPHGRPGEPTAARREFEQLGYHGARWVFPRGVEFSRDALVAALAAARDAARLKIVARVSEDGWLLAQSAGGVVTEAVSGWRRDSRIELVLHGHAAPDWERWDRVWQSCQRTGAE